MAAPTGLLLRGAICSGRSFLGNLLRAPPALGVPPCRNAARKGTREKARKKKVKVEIKKIGFIPHNQRKSDKKGPAQTLKIDDRYMIAPVDDVWPSRYYHWRLYSFEEALEAHRETHHPTIYNFPNAPLTAILDLDLRLEKKDRYLEKFNSMAPLPHGFNHGQHRSILALTKDDDQQRASLTAGANVVGGLDIIKEIQAGELALSDYQFIVADTDILEDLVPVRGLMKRRFPNPKTGTLGSDVVKLVKNFRNGVHYTANVQEEIDKDYGWVECTIGTIDMENEHLKENLVALIKDVQRRAPRKVEHPFVWRVCLKSEPSVERLKIDHKSLLVENNEESGSDSESDDEKVEAKQ